MKTCGDDQCFPCSLRLSLACAAEFERQIARRAFIISEARLKKEGVQAINPLTGQPSAVNICAWHALSPVAKVERATEVARELVARN